MLRATFRTALAHKGRLALSALAVVLGVAFVAGTYVFTDTLQRTFTELFDTVQPDVLVSPASEDGQAAVGTAATLPADAADVVAGVDGVAVSGGAVQTIGVTLIGGDGEPVGTIGPPALGIGWDDDPELSPLRLVEGRGPESASEVAIDTEAFESGGFTLGDTVRVLTPGPSIEAELVGVFSFGTSGNLAGATLTAFDMATAQSVLLGGDRWTGVQAVANAGVSQDELAERVEAAFAGEPDVGPVIVQTGDEVEDEAAAAITEGLGFISTFLLVFAGVALFVGAFIIVNTFGVLIARRTRELALLRAVGASRRQVTWSVLIEAFLVGLVGGVLGLGLGIGLAVILRALFGVIGFDVPAGSLVVAPRTVLVSVGIGVVLTMAAAWFPARRAGTVPPIAALRDDAVLPSRSLHRRTLAGAMLALVGGALLALGLLGEVPNGITLVGGGILLIFVAAALLSAVIGGAVTGLLGLPFRGSTVGRLAVRNAQRDRRRTAATAGALMIGLALVTMIGVLGSSASRSAEATISDVIRADYIVSSTTFQPFSPEVAEAVEQVDGVGVVSRVSIASVRIGDDEAPGAVEIGPTTSSANGIDPATFEQVVVLEVTDGAFASLADGKVALDADSAAARGLSVGSPVDITWQTGTQEYEIGALYAGTGPISGVVVDSAELARQGLPEQLITLYLAADVATDAGDLRSPLEQALAPYPVVSLQDQTELAEQVRGQVNQLLSLVYALLGLAVVIAVLGIVNTLLLSVLERTREIGLLRAVGTDRRQVRRMVRIEALLIALFGALLGVGLGLLFGVAIQRSLVDEGVSALEIPWTLIAVVLVVSALVGVLAAILPARRAANLDVLTAIATE
ncbi:MAG: ABC transporter permease [Jiangellales bacterium]